MTPPPSSHVASSIGIALDRSRQSVALNVLARALDPRRWAHIRLVADVLLLYLASSATLFADPAGIEPAERWIAMLFPLMVMVLLRARRSSDDRLPGSLLDTYAHVIGVVSLSAIAAVAADSALGGTHPVGLGLRLWAFSAVYVGIARTVLLSVRRQAARIDMLAIPTLIVGAG